MTNYIKGIVKSHRKDGIALLLDDGNWYSALQLKASEFPIGSNVEIEYVINGFFRNIEAIKLVQTQGSYSIHTSEIKIPQSMLISYAKDILIALINKNNMNEVLLSSLIEQSIASVRKIEEGFK